MPAPFAAFVERLLASGEAVIDRSFETKTGRDEAKAVLAKAFATHALEVAGPSVAFDGERALAAADLVAHACSCSARRDEPLDEVERCAKALEPRKAEGASAHLSVDLALRFVVHLERRARALEPGSRLPGLLADTLRRWPLTGALSNVTEPPLAGLDLGGHPGLLLLYEERLAANPKAAWRPTQEVET